MGNEYRADPNELRIAAGRINDAVGGMKNQDLSAVAGVGPQCGHEGVASALDQFCTNLTDGVRTLCQDAEDAGTSLEDAAAEYTTTEAGNTQRLDALAPALPAGGGY